MKLRSKDTAPAARPNRRLVDQVRIRRLALPRNPSLYKWRRFGCPAATNLCRRSAEVTPET